MIPNTNKKACLAALPALALDGCGVGAATGVPRQQVVEGGSSLASNFAGRVEGTYAFVAVDEDNRALAHLCDDKDEEKRRRYLKVGARK